MTPATDGSGVGGSETAPAAEGSGEQPPGSGEQPPGSGEQASGSDAAPSGRLPRPVQSLLIGCVIAVVLAVVLFVGLRPHLGSGSASPGATVAVGSTAPGFTLPNLDGGTPVDLAALGSDRSRPVVLNFFASWCGPCRQETPLLASTARDLAARGSKVQFVGVDVGESQAAGRAFAQQSGITYPVGSDRDLSVSNGRYGLDAEPHTFFIDADGVVLGGHLGALDRATLNSWLHRLAGASG